ncbi:MAG: Asp-tRNA(Asn)/Glu-tRNA(Gln) amidotransferase subunit GatB [Candidatus Pacebacteria bacterium]|nr:Asp-tRNA(Asn)/Glu-tRNA(Gln) amidotransferase subunit GatB [Candidatus Paceibacterota bacterium]
MYKVTVGLEIHIELNTKSKMFCSCLNDSDEKEPNKNVCPICLAHPGVLPVINKEAVERVVKTGLALNCSIAKHSFFERKNYFYPDLPKGYQISQYQAPLCQNGYLDLPGLGKRIRIERIHLEEDTGSLHHPEKAAYSLVDFNRSGVPLMELVTEPDIASAQETREFVKELQLILRYLGVSDANMEKGEMRVEVNVSLRPEEQKEFGTKVEVKNLNSIKSVEKSIEFEIARQTAVLEKGEKIIQETRGWHDTKEITFSQRSKEQAHDYRYFPEPDLPPLDIQDDFLQEIQTEIVELPHQKRNRFAKEYHLSERENELYINQRGLSDYFEKVVSELRQWMSEKYGASIKEEEHQKLIKLASNYIATDLQALLKEKGVEFAEEKFLVTPENFAEFLSLIYTGEISSKIAKMVILEMFEKGGDPSQIIEDNGWQMVSDTDEIEKAAQEVIAANPKAMTDYQAGKQASLQFLIGQVMAKMKGRAKPETVSDILKRILI